MNRAEREVCVCERERERERECVCVCVRRGRGEATYRTDIVAYNANKTSEFVIRILPKT